MRNHSIEEVIEFVMPSEYLLRFAFATTNHRSILAFLFLCKDTGGNVPSSFLRPVFNYSFPSSIYRGDLPAGFLPRQVEPNRLENMNIVRLLEGLCHRYSKCSRDQRNGNSMIESIGRRSWFCLIPFASIVHLIPAVFEHHRSLLGIYTSDERTVFSAVEAINCQGKYWKRYDESLSTSCRAFMRPFTIWMLVV